MTDRPKKRLRFSVRTIMIATAFIAFLFGLDQLRIWYVVATWEAEVARARQLFDEGNPDEAYRTELWAGYESADVRNDNGTDTVVNVRSRWGCKIVTWMTEEPTKRFGAVYYPYPWSDATLRGR